MKEAVLKDGSLEVLLCFALLSDHNIHNNNQIIYFIIINSIIQLNFIIIKTELKIQKLLNN